MFRRSIINSVKFKPVYIKSTFRLVMTEARAHTPPVTDSDVPPVKKARLDSELGGSGITRLNPIDIAIEGAEPIATTSFTTTDEPSKAEQTKRPRAKQDPKVKAEKFKARKHAKWLKNKKAEFPEPCSSEDVLWHEVQDLLGKDAVEEATKEGREFDSPYDYQAKEEVEVDFVALSSDGAYYDLLCQPINLLIAVI
jgi:hypothetical protein